MKQRAIPFAITVTLLLCISLTAFRAARKNKKYEVSGTILIQQDYCGGARPADGQDGRRKFPQNGTTLYVCKQTFGGGRSRYFDSIVSDTAGRFSVKLPAGSYCFVEKWKTEPYVKPKDSQFEKWDTTCYRKEYDAYDFSLNVKGKTSGITLTVRRYCSWTRPCCTFSGPLPPAAPPTNRGGNQPGHQE